jgi:hypothetical protein
VGGLIVIRSSAASYDNFQPRFTEDLFHRERTDPLLVSGKHGIPKLRRSESSLPADRGSAGLVMQAEAKIDDQALHCRPPMVFLEQTVPHSLISFALQSSRFSLVTKLPVFSNA